MALIHIKDKGWRCIQAHAAGEDALGKTAPLADVVLANGKDLRGGRMLIEARSFGSPCPAQVMLRFNPVTGKFESFRSSTATPNVRRTQGRKGEIWTPKSAAGKLVAYRFKG